MYVCYGNPTIPCTEVKDLITFTWTFENELTGRECQTLVTAKVIDCTHEVIIGRPMIRSHVLAGKLPSQFFDSIGDMKSILVDLSACTAQPTTNRTTQPYISAGTVVRKSALMDEVVVDEGITQRWETDIDEYLSIPTVLPAPTPAGSTPESPALKRPFRGFPDETEEDLNTMYTSSASNPQASPDVLDEIYIHRTESNGDFVECQRKLFEKYRHVFSHTVHPEGLNMTDLNGKVHEPFNFKIDEPAWSVHVTAMPARKLDHAKQGVLAGELEKVAETGHSGTFRYRNSLIASVDGL